MSDTVFAKLIESTSNKYVIKPNQTPWYVCTDSIVKGAQKSNKITKIPFSE